MKVEIWEEKMNRSNAGRSRMAVLKGGASLLALAVVALAGSAWAQTTPDGWHRDGRGHRGAGVS